MEKYYPLPTSGNMSPVGNSYLEMSGFPLVLGQVVLIQLARRCVDQINPMALQVRIGILAVDRYPVEGWVAHHADVQVGVTKPGDGILHRLDVAEDDFGVEVVAELAHKLTLNRKLKL